MAIRKGDQKHACELLAEYMIGKAPMSRSELLASGAMELCGYKAGPASAAPALHSALVILTQGGVLVTSHKDVERPAIRGGTFLKSTCFYQINPALAGVTDGRLMRELMAEAAVGSPLDAVKKGSKPQQGTWGSVFNLMGKRKETA